MSQVDAVERLLRAADDGTLAAVCARHSVTILTLFGSARTDPASARDVDVAAQLGRTDGDVGALVVDLMELAGTDAVDVLVLNSASPVARFAGLVEALPLWEATTGAWASAQMAAALEFYETDWLRRLDLQLMAG
jgi:hypothetical protein